ncbi:hypothetical protein NXH76_06685 [Blautia schinkii]|nr:hypothetical protein [Blautia schinkii]
MKKSFRKMLPAAIAAGMALTAIAPNVVMAAEEEAGFVFEAEYTDLSYIFGHGYSNEVEGTGCIVEDIYDAEASNGYFVGYLYEEGNELEFHINSDKDVEDATLILRATMEFQDASITWKDFSISVNDEDPIQYRDMKFKKVKDVFSLNGELRPFSDFTIGNISLKEGENVIKLTVNNSTTMTGTMRATAPIVDCIKIQTDSDAQITWNEDAGYPMEDNIG